MPRRQLNDMLQQLDAELRKGEPIDAEERALLEQVRDDLEAVLASDAPPEGPRERVAHALERFGSKHPDLSNLLANALDALGKIGV